MISWFALVLAILVCLALGVALSHLIFSLLFAAFRLHLRLIASPDARATAPRPAKI